MSEKHYYALFVGGPVDGRRLILPEAQQLIRVLTFDNPHRFETFDYKLVHSSFELLIYAAPHLDEGHVFRRLHSCYSPTRTLHSQPA